MLKFNSQFNNIAQYVNYAELSHTDLVLFNMSVLQIDEYI